MTASADHQGHDPEVAYREDMKFFKLLLAFLLVLPVSLGMVYVGVNLACSTWDHIQDTHELRRASEVVPGAVVAHAMKPRPNRYHGTECGLAAVSVAYSVRGARYIGEATGCGAMPSDAPVGASVSVRVSTERPYVHRVELPRTWDPHDPGYGTLAYALLFQIGCFSGLLVVTALKLGKAVSVSEG